MKRIFYLIAVCAVMMSVSGCYRHRYPYDKLAEADGLMEEHYDSAWTILNAIDTAAISSEANRAYYALLYAQCQYKQYIYETDDSLISTAVDYYTRHDDRRKLMRSYYYRGLIHNNAKADAKAVSDIVMAERLARRVEDTLFIAKANESLADLYHQSYHMEEAAKRRKVALELYNQLPAKKRNSLFCAVDLALNYCTIGNHEGSLHILDSVQNLTPQNDTVLRGFILGSFIYAYNYAGRFDKAIDVFSELKEIAPESYSSFVALPKIAQCFMECNELDSAKYYLSLYSNNRQVFFDDMYFGVKYDLAKKLGQYDSALVNLEKECEASNTKISKMFADNIAVVERNSIAKENEENIGRISRLSTMMKFAILIIIIIALSLILLRMKILFQRRELEEKLYAVDQLSREIKMLEHGLGQLTEELEATAGSDEIKDEKVKQQNQLLYKKNKIIESVFGKHIEILDEMSSEYFDKKDAEPPTRASIVKTIEKEIAKFSDKSNIYRFSEIVNESQNNILTELQEEVKALTKSDLEFLILKFAGFSAKSICLILDLRLGNFYNKKRRIKEKIMASGAKHTKKFLAAMDKKRK